VGKWFGSGIGMSAGSDQGQLRTGASYREAQTGAGVEGQWTERQALWTADLLGTLGHCPLPYTSVSISCEHREGDSASRFQIFC
jgi:hypothetical protein